MTQFSYFILTVLLSTIGKNNITVYYFDELRTKSSPTGTKSHIHEKEVDIEMVSCTNDD